MKVRLTRPFYDGFKMYRKGTVLEFPIGKATKPPKSAQLLDPPKPADEKK